MNRKWWIFGVLSEVVFTVSWLAAGWWQGPGYRPVRDDISEMGALTAPHVWWYLVPQAATGVAAVAFALFGLAPALRSAGTVGVTGAFFVAVSSLQNISDAFFRLDCRTADGCTEAQATASWHGHLHAAFGLVCVLFLIGAPFLLARAFKRLSDWQTLVAPSRWTGILMVVGLFGVALPQTAAVHGLLQRTVALIGATFGILIALHLRSLPQTRAASELAV